MVFSDSFASLFLIQEQLSSDLTFLAVLTEKAPGTSYNDITLGHLFITWILPLEFKAKWRILT